MSKNKPPSDAAKYQPTSPERAALKRYIDHRRDHPAPRLRVKNEENPTILTDHPDQAIGSVLLMEALGTADTDFMGGLLGQLANAGTQGPQLSERGINFMLSVIKGINPRDQIEAMLAAQMAAVHMATMTFARRLAHVENIPQQDSAERAFNKLTRTFAMQMETLKRYRVSGEQKAAVPQSSAHDGGRAVAGPTQAPGEVVSAQSAALQPAATDSQQQLAKTSVDQPAGMVLPLRRKSGK
jgi:hypothetical protein